MSVKDLVMVIGKGDTLGELDNYNNTLQMHTDINVNQKGKIVILKMYSDFLNMSCYIYEDNLGELKQKSKHI